MKTTLNIDDTVMTQLRPEAVRQGRTMSELVESALRMLLRSQKKREGLPSLPTFLSGGALVDLADRDALYQAMEGRLRPILSCPHLARRNSTANVFLSTAWK